MRLQIPYLCKILENITFLYNVNRSLGKIEKGSRIYIDKNLVQRDAK